MKFLTIGSDPEFFVLDPKGKPFPATLFAKGTKDKPIPIKSLGKGFFEQRDNLSFEGNIPPCTTKEEFITNMHKLRNCFMQKVQSKGYSLSPNGVDYFADRYLNTAEGMEFGCSKVISAWDSIPTYYNHRATPVLTNCKFRVAGFHIHIGHDSTIQDLKKEQIDLLIARLFDLFLSIPAQIIKPEPERIKTYGMWGMIRVKRYGVECRTLSSYFTQEKWLPWVWDQLMKIELFINTATKKDLISLIQYRYFISSDIPSIEGRFKNLLSNFSNINMLSLFTETKKYL